MTPERYQQVGKLFDEALERASTERADWLRKACGSDEELRAAVADLLAHHNQTEDFLSRPAFEIAAAKVPSLQGQQLGHYRVLSLLGAGGMGEVYLAEDLTLRRKVALKALPAYIAKDRESLRRFQREALAASALNHPNIVTIHEFGAEGGTQFLVTERVEGETLRERLWHGALPINTALELAQQVATALQAAHEAGIIHRDIKPENIMIRRDGLVKVLDFGLAKLFQPPIAPPSNFSDTSQDTLLSSAAGLVLGTVAYMSPEQARGLRVDGRSDLFSLGVVLYEMLTGQRPFTGETPSHIIVAFLDREAPSLSAAGRPFPADLEALVAKALAKEPAQRYPDACALLADLKKLQLRLTFEPETVVTRPTVPASELATLRHSVQTTAPVNTPGQDTTESPASASRRWIWWASAILLVALAGIVAWQSLHARSAPPSVAVQPERRLSYFLTVQKYRDGKPYQTEFQSSGREIFEAGWQFKLNVASPQDGFLYLLNEEPGGGYALLFPLPARNGGSAHLAANEPFQTNWYFFDDKVGTERFRLVWAAQPVPEFEAVRGFVNAQDLGHIADERLSQSVRNYLQQAATQPSESVRDTRNQQTHVTGRGAVLTALVELEHR